MKPAPVIAALVACFGIWDVPARADASGKQDLLFLHAGGVLKLRLEIQHGRKDYRTAWREFLAERFAGLDSDESRDVSREEFSAGRWEAFRHRRPENGLSLSNDVTLADFRLGSAGQVIRRDRFVATLEPCALSIWFLTWTPFDADHVDPLFVRLDEDADRRLSVDEWTRVEERLNWLDRDTDQLLSQAELEESRQGNYPLSFTRSTRVLREGEFSPVLAPTETISIDQARTIIGYFAQHANASRSTTEHGEKNPNTLSKTEFPIATDLFEAADTNGDARLDADEIAAWLKRRSPDVRIGVQMGEQIAGTERVRFTESADRGNWVSHPRQADDGSIRLESSTVDIVVSADPPLTVDARRRLYDSDFLWADRSGDDQIDQKEARRIWMLDEFRQMDVDHDQQVDRAEYVAFRDEQDRIARRRIELLIDDHGSTLFEFVDATADGHLSLRELRRVKSLVANWDRDGDGCISGFEVPRTYRVRIRHGQYPFPQGVRTYPTPDQTQVVASHNREIVPDWFRPMDRNGDGDISRNEFIGPPDDFRSLDVDQDGLISESEAAELTDVSPPPSE